MILEIDCGNTRIKWRIRTGKVIQEAGVFLTAEGFDAIDSNTFALGVIKRVLVSSVLGDDFRRKVITWAMNRLSLNPEFAYSEPQCNCVSNGYQEPEKLGVDRWLAVLAARSRTHNAYIVVDCGSAITVDVVTSSGEHLGGYIAAGLGLTRDSLGKKTVAIKLGLIGYPESSFPGRNTVSAIKAAELAMITGLIDQSCDIVKNYQKNQPDIFITGGDGEWLKGFYKDAIFNEDLVLDGLAIALDAE